MSVDTQAFAAEIRRQLDEALPRIIDGQQGDPSQGDIRPREVRALRMVRATYRPLDDQADPVSVSVPAVLVLPDARFQAMRLHEKANHAWSLERCTSCWEQASR